MLAKKENSPIIQSEQNEDSILTEAVRCVKALLEKYAGADLTKDLLVRIALESYTAGRLHRRLSPADYLDFLH